MSTCWDPPHNPQILSTFYNAYPHQLETGVQCCLCRQHQIIPLLCSSTVLGVVLGIPWMQRLIDVESVSEESSEFHLTYRWSLHIKRQHRYEQRLGAVSFKWRWNKPFPTKPEGFRKLGGFFPLLRLLKSTLVHRPSLKWLCHLNALQKTLKKGFSFYTEILCWSFTQWWLSVPCQLFHQPWWGSAVSSFLQEVMMKSKRCWNSASAACFASFSLIPKCHLS